MRSDQKRREEGMNADSKWRKYIKGKREKSTEE